MSRFWSPLVHGLTPYVPGEQPRVGNLVKLNTNENPYGPSPRVLEALRAEVGDSLRLYPDPDSGHLRDVIAKRHQVGANNVFVGNGSDEVLAFVFLALLKHDKPLLFPDITYSFYPVYCRLFGIQFIEIALNDAFAIDLDNYHVANGGIIFPNPNAPTGHLLKIPDIDALLRTNTSSVVVIDEAYVEFGGQTAVALSLRYPNLLVTRTLSKSDALAGLRVGYAVGHAELIAALTRVKDSFNSFPLDRFAQAGAAAAIQDQAYGREICDRVIASRQRLVAALEALDFQVLPSAANFVLARHPRHMGADLAGRLRERGVLVRNFRQPQRIASFLRITVGTDAQCDALLAALRGLV